MAWLWKNLKRRAKVIIIEDSGRTLPPPDISTPVYYNQENGQNFHGDQNCSAVKKRFLPLASLTLSDLYNEPYDKLTPCPYCAPPRKPEAVPEDVFGIGDGSEGDLGAETEAETNLDTFIFSENSNKDSE